MTQVLDYQKVNKNTFDVLKNFKELVDKISGQFFFAVMGGIAVDGYAGKLTRNHPDVDMLIFRKDLEKVENILTELGYKHKRFRHPKEPDLEYKMQTGGKDHLFSFQIIDRLDSYKFEISFWRNPHMIFPLSFIKPPVYLELEGIRFPAVSKEFLIELKLNEVDFFKKLKNDNPEKYFAKRYQQHLNCLRDLKILEK